MYALTVICMLTINVICIPLMAKSANTAVNAYLKLVYCRFGGGRKILSDNGRKFKNSLFSIIATQLGIKHSFSSPHRPQGNRCIEASHKFLKNYIR